MDQDQFWAAIGKVLDDFAATNFTKGGAAVGAMYDLLMDYGLVTTADDLIVKWAADHSQESTRILVASVAMAVV